MNPSFQKNAVALFCMEKDPLTNMASPSPESINLLNAFNRNTLNFAAEYRDGILLVLTFSDARRPLLDKILSDAVDAVRRYIPAPKSVSATFATLQTWVLLSLNVIWQSAQAQQTATAFLITISLEFRASCWNCRGTQLWRSFTQIS